MAAKNHHLRLRDIAQIAVGAGILALPISMSKDTWEIANQLPLSNIFAIAGVSVLMITSFVYATRFQGSDSGYILHLVLRVLVIYTLTLIISSATLIVIGQAPWQASPIIAWKQTVLVALPASFAAAILDHLC